MIKKLLLTCAATLFVSALTNAQEDGNSVMLSDVEFSVDTLFHAQVGPGTTQTSLHLINKTTTSQQLRVFYLTVDLTNPLIDIEAIVANDRMSGGQTVSNMASSHSSETKSYFVGVNTDFFVTSGNATNGVSMVGAPVSAAIAGGEIYRTAETSSAWPTFFIDNEGNPNIGAISFGSGTATCGDQTVKFSVVNTDAANDAVSLYTPAFYGVVNQPGLNGNCAEVIAKAVEGDFVQVGKPLVLEITAEATSTGNREIPEGEYAIVGRGSTLDFVKNMKIGDKVALTAGATVDGTSVIPTNLATGNPWILKAGERLESEGDRGDASGRHPRTSVGYNSDKTKMIMMVIDGRSAISAGVHTKELADMMLYAGASDAINVDGGGSSTLYTKALGVRNSGSDGHERAVASGMFAVANIPEDNEITEIKFVDWAMVCPKYGIYTPKFYGYNKYGALVNTDLQDVVISCDPKLGEITNEGKTFYATGEGTYALTATYNGLTATIPVTVEESDNVSFRLPEILIDNKREYPIEVNAIVGESLMPINPVALTWSSNDNSIAEIGESTGVLKGIANGNTTITGTVGDFTGTLNVTVEIPESDYMPVYREFPEEGDWTLKQLGGTGLTISEFENGFKLNYVGNGSSRGAYIEIENPVEVWSLPESLRLRINPGKAIIKSVTVVASNALGNLISPWEISSTELPQNEETEFVLSLSDWCDPNDIGIYPITINKLTFSMGKSEDGEDFEIQIPNFEAYYGNGSGGVTENFTNPEVKVYPNPVSAGSNAYVDLEGNASISIFNISGAKVMELNCQNKAGIPTEGLNGIYILQISNEQGTKIAKLIVK